MSTKVAVIGTGYVGLTTGVCLAHLGHDVTCVDIDIDKVERLSRGDVPIVEAGLADMLAEGVASKRLRFAVDASEAVSDRDVVFLCLPTPMGENGSADLSHVLDVAAEIAPALAFEAVVVNKSTVPVGSARLVARRLERPDVAVVSNPEFLREGSAVADFLKPDRVVIGADDRAVGLRVAHLYEHLGVPLVITDPVSAELVKYAANSYLAMKLSFVNEIATLCERVGGDVNDVMVGVGSDHRIGPDFLRPGPGWGGSCFGKDTRALLHSARDVGVEFALLDEVLRANETQFDRIVDKIAAAVEHVLETATVAVWGLTYKARTDDLRDSPSLAVIQRLLAYGARVRAHDPTVTDHRDGLDPRIEIAPDPLAACADASVLVVLTEWDEYRWVDPRAVAATMRGRAVIDARNLLDRADWSRDGFTHIGVGR